MSKIKIAVCISGQIRTWEYCCENIKNFLKDTDEYEFDYFIHTWDTNDFTLIGDTTPIYEKENDFENFIDFYKPKLYKIESNEDFKKRLFKKWKDKHGEPMNTVNLMYSFYKSVTLKKLWERKCGFKYDYVVKIRPDIQFIATNFERQLKILRDSQTILPDSKNFISYFEYDTGWDSDVDSLKRDYFGCDLYWLFKNQDAEEFATFYNKKLQYDRVEIDTFYTQYYHTYRLGFNPINTNELNNNWVVIIRLQHALYSKFLGGTDTISYITNFRILSTFFDPKLQLHYDLYENFGNTDEFKRDLAKNFIEIINNNPILKQILRTTSFDKFVEKNPYLIHNIRRYFKFISKYLYKYGHG